MSPATSQEIGGLSSFQALFGVMLSMKIRPTKGHEMRPPSGYPNHQMFV